MYRELWKHAPTCHQVFSEPVEPVVEDGRLVVERVGPYVTAATYRGANFAEAANLAQEYANRYVGYNPQIGQIKQCSDGYRVTVKRDSRKANNA